MANADNEEAKGYIKERLEKMLPPSIVAKIEYDLSEEMNNTLTISTHFKDPYLDVSIAVDGGEFIASYSNRTTVNIGIKRYGLEDSSKRYNRATASID